MFKATDVGEFLLTEATQNPVRLMLGLLFIWVFFMNRKIDRIESMLAQQAADMQYLRAMHSAAAPNVVVPSELSEL